MNYYSHHIGDFRSGTVNMSRQARWIYRDMLDVYYDTERPLTLDLDVLCDEIGVETDDERRIVERILRFKFEKTEAGYVHARCEAELESYRKKASTARENGNRGGRPRKQSGTEQKPSGFPSGSDPQPTGGQAESGSKTNQEPRTKNQEPEGQEQRRAIADAAIASASSSAKVAAATRPPAARGSRLPTDWVLPMAWGQWAQQERPEWSPDDIRAVADRFRDHWLAKSGKDATKVDWEATWRNWVRNERTMGPRLVPAASAPSGRPLNRQEALEASNREIAARVAGSLT